MQIDCDNHSMLVFKNTSDIAILFVHGGAWITNEIQMFTGIGEALCSRGYTTALLGYRKCPNVFPDPVIDVANGIDELYSRASQLLGYIPKKCILVGHSCGAQLTGLVALQRKWCQAFDWIIGVIGIEGIYDIQSLCISHPTFIDWFLDKAFPCQEMKLDGSPQLIQFERENPFFYGIIYSKDDEYKMEQQSLNMFERVKQFHSKYETMTGSHDGILLQQDLHDKIIEWTEFVQNTLLHQ